MDQGGTPQWTHSSPGGPTITLSFKYHHRISQVRAEPIFPTASPLPRGFSLLPEHPRSLALISKILLFFKPQQDATSPGRSAQVSPGGLLLLCPLGTYSVSYFLQFVPSQIGSSRRAGVESEFLSAEQVLGKAWPETLKPLPNTTHGGTFVPQSSLLACTSASAQAEPPPWRQSKWQDA